MAQYFYGKIPASMGDPETVGKFEIFGKDGTGIFLVLGEFGQVVGFCGSRQSARDLIAAKDGTSPAPAAPAAPDRPDTLHGKAPALSAPADAPAAPVKATVDMLDDNAARYAYLHAPGLTRGQRAGRAAALARLEKARAAGKVGGTATAALKAQAKARKTVPAD